MGTDAPRPSGGRPQRPFLGEQLAEALDGAIAELFHEGGGVATTTSRERWKRWELTHPQAAVSHLLRRVNTSPRIPVRPGRSSTDRGRFRGRRLTEPEMIERTHVGAWTPHAEQAAAGLAKGIVASTEHAHRHQNADGSFGQYTHERTQLHATIIKALLQGGGSHQNPQMHVMAGGPASGKTRLLSSGHVKLPKDHVTINPDLVKEMLPEYRALKAQGHRQAASAVHEESSQIAKKALNIALGQKMNVVNDVVGDSEPGKFARTLTAAMSRGHSVHVHYAHVSTDLAAKRAADRAARTGRHVPEGYLRAAHTSVSQRFHADVQHLPVHVSIHDTTGRVKLIAHKGPRTRLTIRHAKGYAHFLAKGGIRVGS